MSQGPYRIERDSLGEVQVPERALWGAQTQRAIDNFAISESPMPALFIRALGLVKQAAALTNEELGLLDGERAKAISQAAARVAAGEYLDQFPVEVFQTGSGTSSNMNANEVIARIAHWECGLDIHPNDHVNLGQSSNDVIPTALRISAALALHKQLLPALHQLADTLEVRAEELADVVKTGRTHLMDAVPITLGQELGAWAAAVRETIQRLHGVRGRLQQLPLGGTAVGTGLNAHPDFGRRACAHLAQLTVIHFTPHPNPFSAQAGQESAVELAGAVKAFAVTLMKISNDLRWMNSGPLAGLGEIQLPALQPGSSIMPGKVNPVIPEATAQVAAQVIGYETAITVAAQSGNFQLNVMLPMIADNLLKALGLSANAARLLADKAIAGFSVNRERLADPLARNPILVTALNPVIGYEKAAAIAKRAYAEGRPVIDVAEEDTDLERKELEALLDPAKLAAGGLQD